MAMINKDIEKMRIQNSYAYEFSGYGPFKVSFGNIKMSKIIPNLVHDRYHELDCSIEEYYAEIPPVILYREGKDLIFKGGVISDGNHRYNTLRRNGVETIPAVIITEEEEGEY